MSGSSSGGQTSFFSPNPDNGSLPGAVIEKEIDVLQNDITSEHILIVDITHGLHGTAVKTTWSGGARPFYEDSLTYSLNRFKSLSDKTAARTPIVTRVEQWKTRNLDRIDQYFDRERDAARDLRDFLNDTPTALQSYLSLAASLVGFGSATVGALGIESLAVWELGGEVFHTGLTAIATNQGQIANGDVWYDRTNAILDARETAATIAVNQRAMNFIAEIDSNCPPPEVLTTDEVTYTVESASGESSAPIVVTIDLGGKEDFARSVEHYECIYGSMGTSEFSPTDVDTPLPSYNEVKGKLFHAFAKGNRYNLLMNIHVSRSPLHGASVTANWVGNTGGFLWPFLQQTVSDKIAAKLNAYDWHVPHTMNDFLQGDSVWGQVIEDDPFWNPGGYDSDGNRITR